MNTVERSQARNELINLAATLEALATSARESISVGDYAQAGGNLKALSSVACQLGYKCEHETIKQHSA